MKRTLLALLALAMIAGCNGKSNKAGDVAFEPDAWQKTAARLGITGNAGPLIGGLRAQLLVSTVDSQETDTIGAAILLTNTTAAAIELDLASPPVFMLGTQKLSAAPVPDALWNARVTLPPGGKLAMGPFVVETVGTPGMSELRALLQLGERNLSAGVPFGLSAAKWGPTVDGARMRLDAGGTQFAVGTPITLRGIIQNVSNQPMSLRPVLSTDIDSDMRRDLVIFPFSVDDSARLTLPPRALHRFSAGKPLLLAPGKYRLRAVIAADEVSIHDKPAWFGKLVSNDVEIEVK